MIPGEIFPRPGDITLNAGREAITLGREHRRPAGPGRLATIISPRPIPGSFFDRAAARGMRLDIAAGTAVRFEPGQTRDVRLIPYGGARARLSASTPQVMGAL